MGLKEFIKKSYNVLVPPKTPEQIEFEKKLKAETLQAHREEYLKEAVKQSRIRAKNIAKSKYNPQQKQNLSNAANIIANVGVPKTNELKKKIKQDDSFEDLLWRS